MGCVRLVIALLRLVIHSKNSVNARQRTGLWETRGALHWTCSFSSSYSFTMNVIQGLRLALHILLPAPT